MEERYVLRLHASHLTGNTIRPLLLDEAQKVLQLSSPCPPSGTAADDMPILRVQGSSLGAVDFHDFEVNLLVAKAEPFAVSRSDEGDHSQMVLVSPVGEEFLYADKETRELREMTFQNNVWIVVITGGSACDVAEGLGSLSRAGVLREDFHEKFATADNSLGKGSNASVFPVNERDMGNFATVNKGKYVAKLLKTPDQNCSAVKLHSKLRDEVVALVMSRNHPNIVGYAGTFLLDPAEQQWAIIMQRCEGGSLFQAAMENRRHFSEGTARQIMTGIFTGLVHLHQTCRMVHRDLKAENVLLTETGQPVLADFGLARVMPKTGKLHWRCGTPGYMAPEMLLDGGYDTQVDVYAAGGVLHLMLCGQAPFMNSTVVKTLRATLRSTLDLSVNPHFDSVSPLGRQALLSFLQRDPAVRPTAEKAMNMEWFTQEIANVEATRTPMFAQVNNRQGCLFHYCDDTSSSSFEEEPTGHRAPIVPTPPRNPRPRSSSAFVRNKVGGLLRRLMPRRIAAFTTMARAPRLRLLEKEEKEHFPAVTPVAPAMQPVPPSSAAPRRMLTCRNKTISRTKSKPCGDVTAISTGVSMMQEDNSSGDDWSTTNAEDHAMKDYVGVTSRNALRGQQVGA
jgi:serine/threonine protein kinase